MKKHILVFMVLLLCLYCRELSAQQPNKANTQRILTADSLASGNFKDVLTSFFQLAFNDLTGKNKELNFSSNPYALMLKSDPNLATDVNYQKYRHLRKLNFSVGLKMDTSFRFNGFSFGAKYALINNRDSTTSKWLFDELGNDSLNREFDTLATYLFNYIEDNNSSDAFIAEADSLLESRVTAYSSLSQSLRHVSDSIIAAHNLVTLQRILKENPAAILKVASEQGFKELKEELRTKGLWTVGFSDTTYKDAFVFSNILLYSQYLKGFSKQKAGSNFELDIRASLNMMDDSTRAARELKRCLFNAEAGINWVIRNKTNDYSWLEMKMSSAYQHNFGNLYAGEKRNMFTLNGILRLRIIADVWVPLEFRYDPKSGNVFGFLNVRANFNTLGSLFKSK